jgi:hypothetical protein
MSQEESRLKIIETYKDKVHGVKPDVSKMTGSHDGKIGHWLEDVMGSTRDASNKPDLYGYEMKTGGSKTTFGDWGPDYFIFRDEEKFLNLVGKTGREKQKLRKINKNKIFLKAFGVWRNADADTHKYKLKKNIPEYKLRKGDLVTWKDIEKDGFYSWSGGPSPNKVPDGTNAFGQALVINTDNYTSITYSYSKDTRENKAELIPEDFQIDNLKLFGWSQEWIKKKVENKFNVHGWFKCNLKDGKFHEIIFGNKITLPLFLKWVRDGDVEFDTRLKETRPDNSDRYGMQWRAPSTFWKSKAIQTYTEE